MKMDPSELTPEKIREILNEFLEKDVDIVSVSSGYYKSDFRIRIYVDRQGGVSVEYCTAVVTRLKETLSDQGLDPEAVHLEVSSPPSHWPLKTPGDFQRNLDRRVRVKYRDPGSESLKSVEGTIKGCDETELVLSGAGKEQRIPLESIKDGKIIFQL